MSFIEWSKDYELNVAEIDNQHKKLVEILNRFVTTLHSEDFDISKVDKILDELVEYTKYHFETEENYMIKHSYEGYSEHVSLHEQLVGELSEFLIQRGAESKYDLAEIFMFLKHWLVDHILNEDKKIVQVLSESKIHSR